MHIPPAKDLLLPARLLLLLRALLHLVLLTHAIHSLATPAPLLYHLPFLPPIALTAAALGLLSLRWRWLWTLVLPLLTVVLVGRVFLLVYVKATGVCWGMWAGDAGVRSECASLLWEVLEILMVWGTEAGVLVRRVWAKWRAGRGEKEVKAMETDGVRGGWRRMRVGSEASLGWNR